MSDPPTRFVAVNDNCLARAIRAAGRRVVYAAPGLGKETAAALVELMRRGGSVASLTLVLDADADAYRIGYGDPEALEILHAAAAHASYPVRQESGLRLGLLVADDEIFIWAPTARSVEAERKSNESNGLVLGTDVARAVEAAVGADESEVLPNEAQIGREALQPDQLKAMVEDLSTNPPAPFDLSRRTRVFSTRFQFVEFEVRGAEWTGRKVSLSSFLLNADLPESAQSLLETQIRPFQASADKTFDVPLVVNGQRAFREDGERIKVQITQAEILKHWASVRDRYLRHVKGFGWLVRRDLLESFQDEVSAFEEMLTAWVDAFRDHVDQDEQKTIQATVDAIKSRLARASTSGPRIERTDEELKTMVGTGLKKLRMIEPRVRIVVKDISWQGSRDVEFCAALRKAIPASELKGWFDEFTAVMPSKPEGQQ